MLGTASEEVAKAKAIHGKSQLWRDRMEDDYELFRLQKFSIPKREGVWEDFTCNLARVLGDYVVDNLSDARRRLWIPIDDENEKKRKDLSNTERLAIGLILMADSLLAGIPECVDIQSALVWDAAIRGMTISRVFLYEEDGEVVPDVAIFDPLNTTWVSGSRRRGLLWVSNERFINSDDAKDKYNVKDSQIDAKTGKVSVRNVWDVDEEGVIIGGEYVEKEEHGLDHIPIFIKPSGSTRLVQSTRHQDTMIDFAESIYASTRNIYEPLHRLWTYFMTSAGRAAKNPIIIEYDSNLDPQFNAKDNINIDPMEKGRITLLDKAKGQEVRDVMPMPKYDHVQFMLQGLMSQFGMGGVSAIAMGEVNQYMPAAGVQILTHSARRRLNSTRINVEKQFEWIANEFTRQFKDGDFKDMTVFGTDASNRYFETEIKASKVIKGKFRCQLRPDLPQDKLTDMGIAAQAIQSGVLSPTTARDMTGLVDDPDLEQDKIDRFAARQVAEVALWEMAQSLFDDGQKFAAQVVMNKLIQMGTPPPQGQNDIAGIPKASPPASRVGTAGKGQQLQVPPEIAERARLQQIGLDRG